MGNNCRGFISLKIKKEIPTDIKEDLFICFKISNSNLNNYLKSKLHNEFLTKLFNDGSFYFFKINKDNEYDCPIDIITFIQMKQYKKTKNKSVFDKEISNKLILKELNLGFNISYSINTKGYENQIEKLIEWLKPYVDITQENYLGEILDEDNLLTKNFYLDFDIFKKEKLKFDYLCKGCEKNLEYSFCENLKFCKKAYEKGKVDKHEHS